MKWYLLWWIMGCAGADCQISDYKWEPHTTEESCWRALNEKQRKPYHTGVCVELKYAPKDK